MKKSFITLGPELVRYSVYCSNPQVDSNRYNEPARTRSIYGKKEILIFFVNATMLILFGRKRFKIRIKHIYI